jgi:hypothetical protein
MAVVINEFELVAEAPPAPRRGPGGEPASESAPKPAIDPCALARALRALEVQALRVWAH